MRMFAFILAWSFLFAQATGAQEAAKLPILYPFVREGKWGYIDAQGTWVIEPRFDRCIETFEGERARVWLGKRWTYIDRAGKEITKARFTEPAFGPDDGPFEVVNDGKKQGILARSGKVILPAFYDDVVLAEDHAWVRASGKLGVFALDGHWTLKPSILWPKKRDMPIPTDNGAAWFKQGKKWGLLSAEGKTLFPARFAEHVMGRKEAEEWTHPEGLDFKRGRAWVTEGKDYLLIASDGKVLVRQPFDSVREWTDDIYLFSTGAYTDKCRVGLISRAGEIILPADRFSEIKPPKEERAVVVQYETRRSPSGEVQPVYAYGYIDTQGHTIVEPGVFNGPRELTPFSEGLAPVWNEGQDSARTHIYGPFAGYIDSTGAVVIAEQFYDTRPFTEGLGAVQECKPQGQGLNPEAGLWGYVDKSGAIAIAPQFTAVTPFYRGRAWVAKDKLWFDRPVWAMIDRKGNALTDFSFMPPETKNGWQYDEDDKIARSRWRGSLAVVTASDLHNSLATAEGKVLFPPIYNRIGDFHDGVTVAAESHHTGNGNIDWVISLLTEKGETLATGVYTEVSDFDGGMAWASHRWTDHRGPYQHEGWGLIDTAARERAEPKYVRPWWIRGKKEMFTDSSCPHYTGELAPVALAEGYEPDGKKGGLETWERNSWGYMDRTGRIVAWHDKTGAAK